ncbi:MAG: CocE/NonD family hydrolase [Candidatus Latescibacteria bacterium]|nr:CocE/NonD family hydrolase [Candidatus Latescibacterota bacterium]NIO56280.1 CocE/NonD family hydrolase [Candidatus Latescibacterota bacterium]
MKRRLIAMVIPLLLVPSLPAAEEEVELPRDEYIRANYTKYEYRIPMRDGVKLFTVVYEPNDRSAKYPILLFRTPYSVRPYGADRYKTQLGPSEEYEKDGFIFVFQDVRGKYMSEGEFVNMRPHIDKKKDRSQIDESTDTYDTIEWLLDHLDNHNGKVGQWGISYPGFFTSAGMIDSHPALKAASPQAPIADWFWDDMHHHGAFVLSLSFQFFYVFGQERPEPTTERPDRFEFGTPDGYQFFLDVGPLKNANEKYLKDKINFWNEITQHPNYDEFWQSRNILPNLKNIKAAVMIVGGWYDTEDLYGPLKTYRAVEKNNKGIFNVLVMGPWFHGGWAWSEGEKLGDVEFGFKTSEYYRDKVELAFFKHFLKGGDDPGLPEALMFETGANRWRRFNAWPPEERTVKRLYLQTDGRLTFEMPTAEQSSSDAYVSDPAKPVPFTKEITLGWSRKYMTEDQRFAGRRPDVLVYRTDVLKEDLTLAGPIQANLWVSTTGSASDFVVKVIDVYPDEIPGYDKESGELNRGGQQTLVRAEVFRGRFRESYEEPKPFTPNEVVKVSFELQDVLHTFKRGHCVMVQIQSSWFPFIDRNPQKFVPNIFEAEEDDFIKVTNSIHRSRQYPSHLEIGILE